MADGGNVEVLNAALYPKIEGPNDLLSLSQDQLTAYVAARLSGCEDNPPLAKLEKINDGDSDDSNGEHYMQHPASILLEALAIEENTSNGQGETRSSIDKTMRDINDNTPPTGFRKKLIAAIETILNEDSPNITDKIAHLAPVIKYIGAAKDYAAKIKTICLEAPQESLNEETLSPLLMTIVEGSDSQQYDEEFWTTMLNNNPNLLPVIFYWFRELHKAEADKYFESLPPETQKALRFLQHDPTSHKLRDQQTDEINAQLEAPAAE